MLSICFYLSLKITQSSFLCCCCCSQCCWLCSLLSGQQTSHSPQFHSIPPSSFFSSYHLVQSILFFWRLMAVSCFRFRLLLAACPINFYIPFLMRALSLAPHSGSLILKMLTFLLQSPPPPPLSFYLLFPLYLSRPPLTFRAIVLL